MKTQIAQLGREASTAISPTSALLSWLARHSAWLLNHFAANQAGRTPQDLQTMERYRGEVLMFGERVVGNANGEATGRQDQAWSEG